jgi:hypothetical protein
MTGVISMRQREAVMPIVAPMVSPPAMCVSDLRSFLAITYQWNGGDHGDSLTAKRSTRRLGRCST